MESGFAAIYLAEVGAGRCQKFKGENPINRVDGGLICLVVIKVRCRR